MSKPIATNSKARRDYVLTDPIECGIALAGGEVKSIRAGKVAFTDSFARIDKGEVFLHNLRIEPYAQGSYMNENPDRVRKLLLKKKEIQKLFGKTSQRGLTIIPTKLYFNSRGFVKVEIALAKGKKLYDKRETVKKRSINRRLQRVARSRTKGKK